jgi:hypothetical protein
MLPIEKDFLGKFQGCLLGKSKSGFRIGRSIYVQNITQPLMGFRRAKIKRLTADDRERMMKMRAVPDDFDNVQALHSPYGAVHGIGSPMQSPVDFPPYTDHMMRPLMVDPMRRNKNDDHISPTGLTSPFGHAGFAPAGSLDTSDILSPLSLNSTDHYYSSHLSSPMSAGPRSSNPFDRQHSYQALSHSRQNVRSLQPLQLREAMSRSRSESIHSPLRSSMSWKGETLDYGNYTTGQPSPQLSGRQQSVYQHDRIDNTPVNAHQTDGNTYTSSSRCFHEVLTPEEDHTTDFPIETNLQGSPTHITYSSSHGPSSSSLQHSSPSAMSRLRASTSTSTYPPGLDLRNQYRGISSQQPSPHGMPPTPRSSSFANSFTGGFASAPLTAPVDFSLSRTPIDGGTGSRDLNIPQLSPPMAPPQDFHSAYNADLSPVRAQEGNGNFDRQGANDAGSGSQGQSQRTDHQQQHQQQQQTQQQSQQTRSNDDASYLRPIEYETGQKRKRSFTMPGQFGSPQR